MSNESDKGDKLKEIEEAINSTTTVIEKTAKISSDGRQLLVRFPSKISKALNMEKGDKINFRAELDKENPENNTLTFKYEEADDE